MIANQVEAGRRHKRSELFNQFERLENHVGGSIVSAAFEAMHQPAVSEATAARSLPQGGWRNGTSGCSFHFLALIQIVPIGVDAVIPTPSLPQFFEGFEAHHAEAQKRATLSLLTAALLLGRGETYRTLMLPEGRCEKYNARWA